MNRVEIEKLIKINSVKDFADYKAFMELIIPINEDLFNKHFPSFKNSERLGVIASFKSIIILFYDVEGLYLFTKTIKFDDDEWINYQNDLKKLKNPIYNCICCGKKIPNISKAIKIDEDVSRSMWNNGSVDKIITGYGSRFDGDVYFFGICDDCIEKKKDEGIIKFYKRYFH